MIDTSFNFTKENVMCRLFKLCGLLIYIVKYYINNVEIRKETLKFCNYMNFCNLWIFFNTPECIMSHADDSSHLSMFMYSTDSDIKLYAFSDWSSD